MHFGMRIGLEWLTLPSSVTGIGANVFWKSKVGILYRKREIYATAFSSDELKMIVVNNSKDEISGAENFHSRCRERVFKSIRRRCDGGGVIIGEAANELMRIPVKKTRDHKTNPKEVAKG